MQSASSQVVIKSLPLVSVEQAEAVEQFNEDPFFCIEKMVKRDVKTSRRLQELERNEGTYAEYQSTYNTIVSQQIQSALIDIVNNDWSDSGRQDWLNKWCEFKSV